MRGDSGNVCYQDVLHAWLVMYEKESKPLPSLPVSTAWLDYLITIVDALTATPHQNKCTWLLSKKVSHHNPYC